eukprot:TRINITY_DN11125_c0_g1_i1.p1 TRINITY_DN11125_c0_g1~~TRINITY_DN11125_c0_g1_i1.p1  ORF type:complete len:309 (+),score=64.24 TRINITY_DN11125_c0_g1_i1:48-974(+)
MCILAFRVRRRGRFPVVLVCNRDEFESRETGPFQVDGDGVLCARDAKAGGTQCGLHVQKGLFAVLTNVRTQRTGAKGYPEPPPSRGRVVADALRDADFAFPAAPDKPADAADWPHPPAAAYAGFNLFQLALRGADAPTVKYWTSSAAWEGSQAAQEGGLRVGDEDGVHCCSNSQLDDGTWPKVCHLRARLADAAESALPPADSAGEWDIRSAMDKLGDTLCDTPGLTGYPPELDDPAVNAYTPMEKQLQSGIWVRGVMPDGSVHRTRFQTVCVVERIDADTLRAHVWYRSTSAPDAHGAWEVHTHDFS